MKNNEPLYAIQKALTAKLYRLVEAKRKHESMVMYFDRLATHNQRQIKKTDIMIRLNKLDKLELFRLFWELVQ